MERSEITVTPFRSLAAAAHLRGAIDALNLASRRPTPFGTFRYLEVFLANDEYADGASIPLLLAAFRGDALVGFLPLRRRKEKVLGIACHRIEFLVTHDNERPGPSCRPEDERACGDAFWRYLVEEERGWTCVELMEQDATTALVPPAFLDRGRFITRRFENNPNATIPLGQGTRAAYFSSLGKRFRRSVRHQCNRVLAAGEVEMVSSQDPRAALPLLDVYLDVEARSWKAQAGAGISRSPVRLEFFRALCRGETDLAVQFRFLLLDGSPAAAELNATFANGFYGFEVAFDDRYAHVSAGNVVALLSVCEAVEQGARDFNLLNNYTYQKERWGAVLTETAAVQVFRRFSPHGLKATLGTLRRRVLGRKTTQRDVNFNLDKPEAEERPAAGRAVVRDEELCRRTAERLAALERAGVELQRVRGPEFLEALPFNVAREIAK